ncbi:hypothetical protein SteCoe_24715 [Stentor coeruleus]|uniref:Uncharacterized protein n=1 Tax=Stentor coeruleus TaxID=5963 RepID=A0A1R2BGV8_9CILI|nr:hypothetical protein SteCoe_24715 [Stentor coeruleus]
MYQKLNIYKVLSQFKNIKLRVQQTLIFESNSKVPTICNNDCDGLIVFEFCITYIETITDWLFDNLKGVEIKTPNQKLTATSLDQVLNTVHECQKTLKKDPEAFRGQGFCIIKKTYFPSEVLHIFWSSKTGYTLIQTTKDPSSLMPISLRSSCEQLKFIINSYFKPEGLRLSSIDVVFIVHNKVKYFSEIISYELSECESLKRFHNHPQSKCISPRKLVVEKTKTNVNSLISTPLPSPKAYLNLFETNKIDQKIQEIIKNNDSVKYINYKTWKECVDRGGPLLPNEELFAKLIAKEHKKAEMYDSVKEMRKLAMKMTITMDNNRSKRHLQEAVKAGIINNWLIKSTKLSIPKPEKKNKFTKERVEQRYATQINVAAAQLDSMRQNLRRSNTKFA